MTRDEIVSVPGAADLLDVYSDTVSAWVRHGVLEPEAKLGRHPFWRAATLKRWDRSGRKTGALPPSPALRLFNRKALADKLGVSRQRVEQLLHDGRIVPTWWVDLPGGVQPMSLWSEDDANSLLPVCPACGNPVDPAETHHPDGRRVQVRCQCGGPWVDLTFKEAS